MYMKLLEQRIKTVIFLFSVRPLRLDLSGVEEHVHEGAEVVLTCQVTGARPAANITWYNGSEPIGPDATANTHAAVQVSPLPPFPLNYGIILTKSVSKLLKINGV
jgi:CD80-like C2-set immunoglobulin domain